MVGLTADVNTLVKDLSIAQRQMVEVAKALSTNAKLIVMDEPDLLADGPRDRDPHERHPESA